MADTGIWLDKITGKATRRQPERGRLLVAPGKPIPKGLQSTLDAVDEPGNLPLASAEVKESPGTGEPMEAITVEPGETAELAEAPKLKKLGGGWYETPDGERHRGEDAARAHLGEG